VTVAVRVQPRSRRPGLQGRAPAADGECLRIGVTEAAEGGRANRAACATLARALDVPVSTIEVAVGAASRNKTLRILGDRAVLGARLEAL
jgi:uncharacterized protein YggU (UPF0235/DUF167 family)